VKDCRQQWYDPDKKVAVTFADVTSAAQELARAHLSGPVSARYLTEALAAAALLGAEISSGEEVVSVQMKCTGPLGGYNVECTADGSLRGYTERKTLDEFDSLDEVDERKVLGDRRIQVTRSVPGRIVSQGISNSFDGYLAGSLQRRSVMLLSAAVNSDVEVLEARGVLVEALPDSAESVSQYVPEDISGEPGEILKSLGLDKAELKSTLPLRFACRCSPARAAEVLAASAAADGEELPETVDVTCHMCGRTFTVKTR
jgi:molecular chaperone Hsp33